MRADLDPKFEGYAPPRWEFGGFRSNLAYSEILELYRIWRKFGIMPLAGGYFEQPGWWRVDMETCHAIYNTLAHEIAREVRQRKDA